MTDVDEAQEMRKIKVDMDALELAFDDRSVETSYYLDLETGEVVAVTDEISRELEEIYDQMSKDEDEDEDSFEAALRESYLPDWTKDELREADRVETGYGERFIRVPKTESSEAYGDMEDFIATVKDRRYRACSKSRLMAGEPFADSRTWWPVTLVSSNGGFGFKLTGCGSVYWNGWRRRSSRPLSASTGCSSYARM